MNEIIKTDKIDHIGIVVPNLEKALEHYKNCLLYTSPSPRDVVPSRMPSSA